MSDTLLEIQDLEVHFRRRRLNPFRPAETVYAVDGVSLIIPRGKTLGLVGESGSGKTTVARAILRLVAITAGRISLAGERIDHVEGEALRQIRRRMQYIFQDPYSSLNPRVRAGQIVQSPLEVLSIGDEQTRDARVAALFQSVGLRPEQRQLFPHQFSGGQRQRISIARALAPEPDLIVCDEPVSALDVAIRAQILNLLQRLRRERAFTYLFISHDMAVVKHMADEVAVMYLGQIVEQAPRRAFFSMPLHPYSVALMSAVPTVHGDRTTARGRIRLSGDPPSPINPPPGCRFAPRCPVAVAHCHAVLPPLREIEPSRFVRCHRVEVIGGRSIAPLIPQSTHAPSTVE